MDELPQLLLRASFGQQMCWPWTRRTEHAQEGRTGGEEGYVREKETCPSRQRPKNSQTHPGVAGDVCTR